MILNYNNGIFLAVAFFVRLHMHSVKRQPLNWLFSGNAGQNKARKGSFLVGIVGLRTS